MKILLTTGGSGGHIFPAIQVGRECQKQGHECLFVGSLKFGVEKLKESNFQYREIQTCGWTGLKVLKAFVLNISATWKCLGIMKDFQPDIVMGFGSYSAVPACLAARLKGIPTVIHEQNVVPGKANRMLSSFVQRIFLSFPQSRSFFPKEKTVVTGCPTLFEHSEVHKEEARAFFGLDKDLYTLFVFGGSQSSAHINRIFKEAAQTLIDDLPFQIIQVCAQEDLESFRAFYREHKIKACVQSFVEQMDYAYKAADLVISRAGAATITELILFKKSAILIPYPFAGSHQKQNAEVLKDSGFVQMILDQDLNSGLLKEAIQKQHQKKNQDGVYAHMDYVSNPAQRILEEVSLLNV